MKNYQKIKYLAHKADECKAPLSRWKGVRIKNGVYKCNACDETVPECNLEYITEDDN